MQRILVADDDPMVTRFLTSFLEGEGFEVVTAPDGEKALDAIRQHQPDLVILDLVMPFRDGFEVCRMMKSQAGLRQVPVIIISMKEHENDALRAFELGADDYIRKPFNILELLARARKLMSRRGTAAAAGTGG
jgi:DNA-binding response OmpR family regulator